MGIKQIYNDNLRKLPKEYRDVSVMTPKNRICNGDTYANPPFYVRPLGLKPCKNNKNKIK